MSGPVAWRCKDFADGWIYTTNQSDATNYQAVTGCLMQPLHTEAEIADLRAQLATALARAEMFAQKVRDLEWR